MDRQTFLAALLGAFVGGFGAAFGSIFVSRSENRRQVRARLLRDVIPDRPGEMKHYSLFERLEVIVKESAPLGWRDRKQAKKLKTAMEALPPYPAEVLDESTGRYVWADPQEWELWDKRGKELLAAIGAYEKWLRRQLL